MWEAFLPPPDRDGDFRGLLEFDLWWAVRGRVWMPMRAEVYRGIPHGRLVARASRGVEVD